MSTLTVLTVSYYPDLSRFVNLHESVKRHSGPDVKHLVVVPDRDVPAFESIATDRLEVHPVSRYLPKSFLSTYPIAQVMRSHSRIPRSIRNIQAVNLRRPWPPIRGWALQQVVKLTAAGESGADVVLTADSDVTMIRSFGADDFIDANGAVRFYRRPGGIGPHLIRHVRWHAVADRLLRTPAGRVDPTTDYISSPLAWSPVIIREMAERITRSTGKEWRQAIASELDFSECILYGAFVEGFGTDRARSFNSVDSLCRVYWDPVPLDSAGADLFVSAIGPQDLAIVIQSTSGTPDEICKYIVSAAEATTTSVAKGDSQ